MEKVMKMAKNKNKNSNYYLAKIEKIDKLIEESDSEPQKTAYQRYRAFWTDKLPKKERPPNAEEIADKKKEALEKEEADFLKEEKKRLAIQKRKATIAAKKALAEKKQSELEKKRAELAALEEQMLDEELEPKIEIPTPEEINELSNKKE